MCSVCLVKSGRYVEVLMFTVTQRLDRDPGGLHDKAKVIQVRPDFSSPPSAVAPRSRPAGPGLCKAESPVEPGRREAYCENI